MKNAIILGSNAGQADIIRYLKKSGWYVHTCGHQRRGLGIKVADEFHLVDIKDVNAVTKLAKNVRPDLVYSVSSDIGIRTATKVSEKMGLPHLLNSNFIDLFHFKDKLRSFLNKIDISNVRFKVVENQNGVSEWNQFPCMVKPVDSHGQRGLTLVKSTDQLSDAVKTAIEISESSSAMVEEYLEGVELSTIAIIQNGNIIVNEFTERLVHDRPLAGIPRGHLIPVRSLSHTDVRDTAEMVESLINELDLTDAVLYIQCKFTEEGPKIIEVTPRLDGCHIWRLIKIAKGYDIREYVVDLLMGTEICRTNEIKGKTDSYFLGFHNFNPGDHFSVKKLEMPENILFNEFRYHENEQVIPVNGKLETVGYYIRKGFS